MSNPEFRTRDDLIRLRKRIAELEALSVYLFNQGYGKGHNDTVEGGYIDIHSDDMDIWHYEEVAELIADKALKGGGNEQKD